MAQKDNQNMCAETQNVLRAQLVVALEIRRRGYVMKVIAAQAQMHINTFLSYFPADQNAKPAQLPLGAFNQLEKTGALDADLLGLLLNDGRQIVQAPEGIDHHAFAKVVREYLAMKSDAHHPTSESGADIGPNEDAELSSKVASIRGA